MGEAVAGLTLETIWLIGGWVGAAGAAGAGGGVAAGDAPGFGEFASRFCKTFWNGSSAS